MIADVIGYWDCSRQYCSHYNVLRTLRLSNAVSIIAIFPAHARGKSATHSSEIARRLSKGGAVVADRHSSERASKKDRSLSICHNAARTTTTCDDAIDRCRVPATDRTSFRHLFAAVLNRCNTDRRSGRDSRLAMGPPGILRMTCPFVSVGRVAPGRVSGSISSATFELIPHNVRPYLQFCSNEFITCQDCTRLSQSFRGSVPDCGVSNSKSDLQGHSRHCYWYHLIGRI